MKESLEMQWRAISDGPPQSRTIKVTALLIGLVTALCFGLGGHWYAALAFGLIGYCLTRYVAWGIGQSARSEARNGPPRRRRKARCGAKVTRRRLAIGDRN
jgi:hypothetical protein